MIDHAKRIRRLASDLVALKLDALLVTDLTNVRYLTGFSGTNGQVLVHADGSIFLSDPRYAARAKLIVQGAEIDIYPVEITDILDAHLGRLRVGRLGIEAASMTLSERDRIVDALDLVETVPTEGVVEKHRRIKDVEEVALIKEAVAVADDAFAWVLDRIGVGATEREIALDLEMRMRLSGADEVSFPLIVASGPLSAHVHHSPSSRPLEKGDVVLMDFGARVDGYCSDLTRTVALGGVSENEETVYAVVLEAQRRAISETRSGAEAAFVDRIARRTIDGEGYGDFFSHGLGHGVGLDIHEAPRLRKTSTDGLVTSNVVTIEPGIYLPDRFGIRIEDCVLVTDDGCEILGTAPKDDLIIL
jgi:Xaa-Pro aminopeptidase